jgi:hypothetical protein
MRNVIEPGAEIARKAQEVLSQPPCQWDEACMTKAASDQGHVVGSVAEFTRQREAGFPQQKRAQGFGVEEEEAEAPAEEAAPFQMLEDEVYKAITERVRERIKKDLESQDVEEALGPEDSTMAPNDTIVKEGGLKRVALDEYRQGLTLALRTASCDADFVDKFARLNKKIGLCFHRSVYRAVLAAGPLDSYPTKDSHLAACEEAAGRSFNPAEARVIVRVGKLLSRLGATRKEKQ